MNPGICIITETFFPVVGGGESQARSLAEGLMHRDFPVVLLTRRSDPTLPRTDDVGGVRVYRLWPAGPRHYYKWGLLLSAIPALIRYRSKYDAVIVSGFRVVGMAAVVFCRLFRKICVLKADSLGEMSGAFFRAGLSKYGRSPDSPALRLFIWCRNILLKRAHAFVAISTAVFDELIEAGISGEKIHRIPNGVDTNVFRPATEEERGRRRTALGLQDGHPIIVYTGRLVSYKGLPLLLSVWDKLVQEGVAGHLLLVGSGGLDIHNCEPELREFVESSGLTQSVTFTGAVNNVQTYLQVADIFVFPTKRESFGLSLVEAMSCGLPAISTGVGGVADIVRDSENAIVVAPDSASELEGALRRLIGEPYLGRRLGSAARQTVLNHYSTDSVADKYSKLIAGIHAKRSGSPP